MNDARTPLHGQARRVAIIGGGISGMAAAWYLSQQIDVALELYEADARVGGHTDHRRGA